MRIVLLLLVWLPYALAVRQIVEIERRPNPHHEMAGTFAFVVGLIAFIAATIVAVAFVGAYMRRAKPPKIKTAVEHPVEPALVGMRFTSW